MIEDIEGATSEPSRRGHAIVLSAATAAVALALLITLVIPPSVGVVADAPSPSTSKAPTMTVVSGASGSAGFVAGTGRVTLDQAPSRLETPLVCVVPRPDVWGTFVLNGVSYVVGERTGPAVLPPPAYVGTSSPSVWLTVHVYDRTGQQLLYRCGAADALAPRVDLTNIPR